jgi:hypothetical protein
MTPVLVMSPAIAATPSSRVQAQRDAGSLETASAIRAAVPD